MSTQAQAQAEGQILKEKPEQGDHSSDMKSQDPPFAPQGVARCAENYTSVYYNNYSKLFLLSRATNIELFKYNMYY